MSAGFPMCMPLDIVVAVNDEAVLRNNLMRSALLQQPGVSLQLQRGYASASLAYGDALSYCRSDTVVFVHQDVYLPVGWPGQLQRSLQRLQRLDPDWAVLGVYGVQPNGAQVGCVWSSGLDALFGRPFEQPTPVNSIDEVLIVLRRSSGVGFDPALPGFHLYATDLVQAAQSAGWGAYAIFAPVIHNSRPSPFLGSDYFEAYRHLVRKWRDRLPIHNNVANLLRPGPGYWKLRARHRFAQWRWSRLHTQRMDRRYDCVCLAQTLGFE